MPQQKRDIRLGNALKGVLIGGAVVTVGVIVYKIYDFLTEDQEKLRDLPVNKKNLGENFDADKAAKILYDAMKGQTTGNLVWTNLLLTFNRFNDDQMAATHNSWNNTIPNQGKSLYTWIDSEWCNYGAFYSECKEARSTILQRLRKINAHARY